MPLGLPCCKEGHTPEEQRIIAQCNDPASVQQFLHSLDYNWESDGVETLRSFRGVVRTNVAHCMEGAAAAAVLLQHQGVEPMLLTMEARDIDHTICTFRHHGYWGALAKSRDEHLRDRAPIFSSPRELVLSYYPHHWHYYTGDRSDLTIRGFTLADPEELEGNWQTAEGDIWQVERLIYDREFEALFPKPGQTVFRSNPDDSITWLR